MPHLYQRRHNHFIAGQVTYNLDVWLQCNDDERRIISVHNLGRLRLYADPDREALQADAHHTFESSHRHNVFSPGGARHLIFDTCRALTQWLMAQTCYVITVSNALTGTTITCRDLHALLACEEQIQDQFDHLARIIDDALAFEGERETVYAPDGDDQPAPPAPATWANPTQGY